jgi:anaerobic dimethyl sulfoxide reductase subunit A
MQGCPRGFLYHRVAGDPARLRRPLLRTGPRGSGRFRPVGWEEALELVARRIGEIGERWGREAIMRIGGSGSCRGALHNTASLTRRFLALGGGYTETAGNFSSAAAQFTKPYLFGTPSIGVDVKSLLESKLLLLWGFNPADTRLGVENEGVFDALRRRGVPIVVIDPRRSASVERWQAEWLPIRPGTDAALMEGMLFVLLEEGLADRRAIERLSSGFDELEAELFGRAGGEAKSPERAARLCGVPAEQVRRLARRLAEAQPAALLPGLSIQRNLGGEEADRLGAALQLAAGNLGEPGGSAGAGQWNWLPGPRCGKLPVPQNPCDASVPVYRWADAVLRGRAGGYPSDIRMLYSVGGNYAVQGPDTARSIAALEAVEFTVAHDYFLTDTCRYADVVLPATTFLERRDILFSYSNYLLYSEKVCDPPGEARDDYTIFAELAGRLGYREHFTEGLDADGWLERFLERSEVSDREAFMREGIYAGDKQRRVALADFAADPEAHPLPTPSGRIEFASGAYAAIGGPRVPRWSERWSPAERCYPLLMVSPHEKFRNNSQFDNIPLFKGKCDDRLWIHPEDAAPRGIRDGDPVGVESSRGRMYTTARVTEGIVPGTVSCTQGRWFRPAGTDDGEGSVDLQWGVNALTSAEPTLPSEGSRTHSNRVEVWRVEED